MSDRVPRSPLKETIKRAPGQSAQEHIDKLFEDKVAFYAFVIVIPALLAVAEWGRAIFNFAPHPVVFTVYAVLAAAWGLWRIFKLRPVVQQLQLGIDGEREVGQILSETLSDFKIFHDIPCDGFNIDHALIGGTGVFSIETKTRSKKGGVEEKVIYDGEKILVNGFESDRDAIVQARANAKTLTKIILDQTGKRVAVTPIVVFPGWYVESRAKNPEVMVINPKMLAGFVRRGTVVLGTEDIIAMAAGLLRHQEHMAKAQK